MTGTDWSLPPPDAGLGSWPARRARITPDSIALSQGERELTYAELAQRTDAVAEALAERGVAHGDRVAYLGLNDITTFETFFGSGRLGALFVPLNHRLSPTEIDYMLADSGARVLVCGPGVHDLARSVLTAADTSHRLTHVLSTEPIDGVPTDDYQVALDTGGDPPNARVDLDDPALFLYTSGTTGRPKAAVLTHGNLTWNTVNQLAHLDVLSTDRALCVSPLFHAVGLGQVTLPVLFKGGAVEVVPKFDAGLVLDLIEALEVASFACVPTMLQLMTEHPAWATASIQSLRYVLYGGSPVAEATAAAWLDRGVAMHQGYGMTEAAPGVAMVPAGTASDVAARPVSVGVPHFFTDIAVLRDDDTGAPLTPGSRGELLIRGPHVFAGYWGRPTESVDALLGPEADWYRTGDVLEAADDGWLSVVDRVKDLIISGGENIYPAEIESLLVALPAVRSAAVVAAPDARWGEVGVAYVEAVAGHAPTPDDLLDHLRGRLAHFKLPREVVLVDHLPRNATGKILRTPLRDDAAHRAPRQEGQP